VKYSSLVFDLDGTISDPSIGITGCFNYALEKHGHDKFDASYLEKYIGPPLDVAFKDLLSTDNEKEVEILIATYRERYSEVGFCENTIYTGIVDSLETLKSRGIKMGICTSKRKDFAEKVLNLFDIANYFEFVSGGDVGITKSSQLAELIHNGAIDSNAIMIGDRAIDISSARDNGLDGVGVLWGFGDYEELSNAKPVLIISSTDEVVKIAMKEDN
jgi:phosphoglycolate phosphatase